MQSEPEPILENARLILNGLRRMACYAQDAAKLLDARIEDEDLNGIA